MGSTDPRWPKVLSLAVHEFRTPMTVVAGYIRMLLKDRAGTLTEQQRRLLEEAEKSCARLSALIAEMSDLSNLEGGTTALNRGRIDLNAVVRAAVEQLPPLPDRHVPVVVEIGDEPMPLEGDPARLAQAIGSVIASLRRELVGEEELRIRGNRTAGGYEILVGDRAALDTMAAAPADATTFDEWRGGVGLSLPVARRILNAHGASIFAPPDHGRVGARILFS